MQQQVVQLAIIIENYWELLRIIENYWELLRIIENYLELLRIIENFEKAQHAAGGAAGHYYYWEHWHRHQQHLLQMIAKDLKCNLQTKYWQQSKCAADIINFKKEIMSLTNDQYSSWSHFNSFSAKRWLKYTWWPTIRFWWSVNPKLMNRCGNICQIHIFCTAADKTLIKSAQSLLLKLNWREKTRKSDT